MKVVTTITEMQSEINRQKELGKSIGFVPTMGFLHEGHLTLMKKARQENDIVVISIFVNPIQFGPGEDYETYPRDFERDLELAQGEKIDYLFHPSVEEMYPHSSTVKVVVQERTDVLCGKSRPGHFDGVATILTKLFTIMMPTRAYFGKKDAQQVAVVEGLISDFHFPIQLVPVDIVREEDGLAKSSRNVKLLHDERKQATALYRSLQIARETIENGERNPINVIQLIERHIKDETSGIVDYIEVYSYPSLNRLEKIKGSIIIALAVKFSRVRLIDNVMMDVN
ncbi:pantoate--beta-alanine ligase [Neobacillus sp. PS3-40]|uniref:pantoate--beta-alanine ligase n=1 Tax=Neobacillus sp. PS3-40 TaxID=3070679 RepID=UPI0027E0663E|nr:pantoate--beta-alanine ligase [Neobacillus sp. PS3-40]WML45086.1 pantoate--beta-alanine ligase [Neobacillus sp. PS3-40]